MRLERVFEVTINTRECADDPATIDARVAHLRGEEALEEFAKLLRAYGMDARVGYTASTHARAVLTVAHPEPLDARRVVSRGGGRPRKGVAWPAEMGATDEERLEWVDAHTEAEAMEALGVSRATLYRRLRELREAAGGRRGGKPDEGRPVPVSEGQQELPLP